VWSERSVVCPIVVGRGDSLHALDVLAARARGGQGRLVLVAGEAGIGKSRLVAETRARVAGEEDLPASGMRFLQCACFEPDRALPFAPFQDLLRTLIRGQDPEEVRAVLGAAAPELAKIVPELVALLPGVSPSPVLEPAHEKRRLVESLVVLCERLAAERPLLLAVEDLHWSDEASLEVLLALARRIAAQPILLLATYRSDEVHPELRHFLAELDRGRLATELAVSRLSAGDVDAMLRAIFQLDRPARADFLDALFALTDGNPFFVEEVLKSLLAAGDIFYADGVWDRKPLAELHIPRSVNDAVQRRTHELSTAARQLLTLAAVAGRHFDLALLQTLTGSDEREHIAAMKELVLAQLVVEVSGDQFAFRHALTRQAVYSSLLARERKTLHRDVAAAIERTYADRLDLWFGDLSLHFTEAEEWARALAYAQQAGRQALALQSPRAAVEHFDRALAAAGRLPTGSASSVYHARGLAYEILGDFPAALADLELALALARAVGDVREEWQLHIALGILWSGRDYARAGDHYQAALPLARASADPRRFAESLNRFGNWLSNVGRTEEAIAAHREALTVFLTDYDRPGMAETLGFIGIASTLHGDQLAAIAGYDDAIDLFRVLGDDRGLSVNLAHRGVNGGPNLSETDYAPLSTREDAERELLEGLRLARQIDWPAGQAFAEWGLGSSLGAFGDFDAALAHAREAMRISGEIGHQQWWIASHWTVSQIALCLLDAEQAIAAGETVLSAARELGSAWWRGNVASYLAMAYLLADSPERAGEVLTDLWSPDREPRNSPERRLAWAWARLTLHRGDPKLAIALADRLTANAPGTRQDQPIPALCQLKGEALLVLDRPEDAVPVLEDAKRGAVQRHEPTRLWPAHAALARAYRHLGRRPDADREAEAARTVIDALATTLADADQRARFRHAAVTVAALPDASPSVDTAGPFARLTSREREVARLLALGRSNREIAEGLFIGERTVETHVGNILAKLGLGSRAQVAAFAGGVRPEPGAE
jgi:DNA-binding CsgD family transcriptional regulator/tetratricopeptide (TPR) repeat protein